MYKLHKLTLNCQQYQPRFKVQGLFIRHILNYTGYNQKLNVNQVRSAQWTVEKNEIKVTQHKSIYINIGKK